MKPKVLLLQETVSSYNVPVYDLIAKEIDLTVGYALKNECNTEVVFEIKKLNYYKIGGFYFILDGFYKMCSKYDVVIFMPDLHYVSYCSLPFSRRKNKVIAWSIGIRASYTKRYDVTRDRLFLDKIYGYIMNKAEAVIFYMKEPITFWGNRINKEKIFIAHNTVDVIHNKPLNTKSKNRILFVGTLYKEKKIYELLDAYIEAKMRNNLDTFLVLDIIGKGEEFDKIKDIINQNKLSDSIILHGPIYDELKLEEFFSNSIICISPDQAGLSVLKSMGYGVPYITRENAITGGERLNIINGENGILYKNKEELINIISEAFSTPSKYYKMGVNAKKYYDSNATISHMAQGFLDAIDYVQKEKVIK